MYGRSGFEVKTWLPPNSHNCKNCASKKEKNSREKSKFLGKWLSEEQAKNYMKVCKFCKNIYFLTHCLEYWKHKKFCSEKCYQNHKMKKG